MKVATVKLLDRSMFYVDLIVIDVLGTFISDRY